jgi:phosphoglycerol transferase MdoB-like AlkP superfamily enzyme
MLLRILFLVKYVPGFSFIEWSNTIWNGILFDWSVVLLQIWILRWIDIFKSKGLLFAVQVTFLIFFIFWYIDFTLFREWQSIFNYRAAKYLYQPFKIIKNISSSEIGIGILLVVGFWIMTKFMYNKLLQYKSTTSFKWKYLFFQIVLIPIVFFALRGGFSVVPKTQSHAFHSTHRVHNLASINSTWNFFTILINFSPYINGNPYKKFDEKDVNQYINQLFSDDTNPTDTNSICKLQNPNIVLITLEGVGVAAMQATLNQQKAMPFLDSLSKEGIYFSNFYATGFRTEQGLASLLSGALSLPFNNLTDDVNALKNMPSIIQTFRNKSYQTNFLFGGDIEFMNVKAYLKSMGFQSIKDVNAFNKADRFQKLGVPDAILFNKAVSEISTQKAPFFYQILTQSTHTPFDIPGQQPSSDEAQNYLKAAKYLDNSLDQFFKKMSKLPCYKNTIFIITSDHAHHYPQDISIASSTRFHIPLIIFSPSSLNSNFDNKKYFAQNDFPATLMHILGWKEKQYLKFSRNYFSNNMPFTFSTFVDGYYFQNADTQFSQDYRWPVNEKDSKVMKSHKTPMYLMQYLVDDLKNH